MSETTGAIIVLSIIAYSFVVAFFMVYIAKVEWFRERLLRGNRLQGAIALAPIVTPPLLFAWLVVVPMFK